MDLILFHGVNEGELELNKITDLVKECCVEKMKSAGKVKDWKGE